MVKLLKRATLFDAMDDAEAVWQHVLECLSPLGIDCLIYLTVNEEFKYPVLLTNIPELYKGIEPETDPFLSHCCQSYEISQTGPAYLPNHAYLPDHAKAFIKTAQAVGFETGLGIPMRLRGSPRFGGFNIGTAFDRCEFESKILPRAEELRTFCLLAHRRLEELQDTAPPAPCSKTVQTRLIAPESEALVALSPREREIAYLVACGYSRKECARLCALSPNTVSEYIKSLYRKLGINNRAELAALAHSSPVSLNIPPV